MRGGARAGAGRPGRFDEPVERITVTVPARTVRRLDALARNLDVSRAEALARVVDVGTRVRAPS